MCKIITNSKLKTFTGYKAVIEKNGKYYSPSTGYRYRLGKLPNMKKLGVNSDNSWTTPFGSWFYEEKMQGKTGLFKSIEDVKETFIDNNPYTILEMTISCDLYNGLMATRESGYKKIIIGSEITSIKKTKHTTK